MCSTVNSEIERTMELERELQKSMKEKGQKCICNLNKYQNKIFVVK
jgi:hypothetical protein